MKVEEEEKPKRCKTCNIIGTECAVCGWHMKLLNLYVEGIKVPTKKFLADASLAVPPGTKIRLIQNHGATTICEVGFDLDPETKLRLSYHLANSLIDRPEPSWFQRLLTFLRISSASPY